MKKAVKNLVLIMTAMVLSMGFVACKENEDTPDGVNLEGKWLMMTNDYKELLIINADHTLTSTGADGTEVWANIAGRIDLDGDNFTYTSEDGENSVGTYILADNKLTLNIDSEVYVYNKLVEEFSLVGSWNATKTLSYIKAVKDELHLPSGSTVNGEEIPTVIQTANIKGEFVDEAIKAYFRNVEFNEVGEITYNVVKDGVETPMIKDYVLADNMLKITGTVGNVQIENTFMAFQNPNQKESFLFLTKENVADMFVGYALMLREGHISEGSIDSLEDFKEDFMEVFENFAVIIYLEKK